MDGKDTMIYPAQLAEGISRDYGPDERALLAQAAVTAAMRRASRADHIFGRGDLYAIADLATKYALGLTTLPEQGEQ